MAERFKRLFPFSDELSGDADKKMSIQDAKGLNILCDDGRMRFVHEIVHSHRYKNMCIINEKDGTGGHFVHYFRLTAQMLSKRIPTADECKQFDEAVKNRIKTQRGGLYDAGPTIFRK